MILYKGVLWTCATLLAVAFFVAGMLKLAGPSAQRWSERFAQWGYPPNVGYVVGVVEILGGLGLLIPKVRRVAAAVLVVLMIGAAGTHVVNGEYARIIPPLVLGGLACLIYSARSSTR